MQDSEIFAAIVAAVREETDNPDIVLQPSMTASDVPGWDSLAHVRIVLNVSVRLNLDIDISQTYRAATVGDLVPIFRAALANSVK